VAPRAFSIFYREKKRKKRKEKKRKDKTWLATRETEIKFGKMGAETRFYFLF